MGSTGTHFTSGAWFLVALFDDVSLNEYHTCDAVMHVDRTVENKYGINVNVKKERLKKTLLKLQKH